MLPDFDSLYQWKNSSPPLCVTHIRKGLDLLFHLVCPELIFSYKNHKKNASWKKKYRFSSKSLHFSPNPHCKISDFKMLNCLVIFFVWIYIVRHQFMWIYEESASFSLQTPLMFLCSSRTQPGPQNDTSHPILILKLSRTFF